MKIYVDATFNEVCLVIEVSFEGLTARATEFFDINAKTNNEAEYLAVLSAIKYLARESCATIASDSALVVNQLNRNWKINKSHLRQLAERIWNLIKEKQLRIQFVWVPREANPAGERLEET